MAGMSLVGGGPYPTPPAEDPNYKYTKVIILMTDGLNTQNRWYTSQTSIDARQATTCANIKAAGITLYTVQVNTGGDPTSTLLQNCASDTGQVLPADLGEPDGHHVHSRSAPPSPTCASHSKCARTSASVLSLGGRPDGCQAANAAAFSASHCANIDDVQGFARRCAPIDGLCRSFCSRLYAVFTSLVYVCSLR